MALEFSDFDLPPEERVKMREKAFESFTNIAQPAYQEQVARERGQLAQDVYQQAAGAAASGQPSQIGGILGQAAGQTAKLLPSQAQKSDELAMQGAQMKEDIISSRQLSGIDRYAQQTEDMKISTARKLANQAFQMGMDAKQLALAQNSYLADEGLRRMYDDLQAGRLTQQEVMALQSKMQLEAEQANNALKQEEAKLRQEIDTLLASRNVEAARARYKEIERLQKAALEKSAKASSTGNIIAGVFKVGATVVGGIYGGPGGAMAASKGADVVTEAVQK
jgi:hypothetical protein